MDRFLEGEWPFLALWLFFLSGAMMRGSFMHWLGRRVRRFDQAHRGLAERPAVLRAQAVVQRYGAPAVTLAHLTVGVQSAIMVASGLLLMPWRRFLPALLLGAALWATIYTTVGMSVVYAALGRLHWSWLVAAGLAVLGLALARRRLAWLGSPRGVGEGEAGAAARGPGDDAVDGRGLR